jgi:hypothetical protein
MLRQKAQQARGTGMGRWGYVGPESVSESFRTDKGCFDVNLPFGERTSCADCNSAEPFLL